MKNLLKIAFIAGVSFASFSFAADNVADKVVGSYKGGEVKESQVLDQFKALFDANPEIKGKKLTDLPFNLQDKLVRSYINLKLLDSQVQKDKIEDTASFKEKLDTFKKQLAQQELLSKVVLEKVTPEKIEEEYTKFENENKNQDEVKVRHILVATEKEAKAIKQRLNAGEKFNDLAKKLSKDEGSKAKGGELGYIKAGQTVPEFEAIAFSLKKGEVSDIVKTQFGFHIIKLEDKRKVKLPAKEEGMSALKSRLENQAADEYIQDLNKNNDVKIFLEDDAAKSIEAKTEKAPQAEADKK